MRVDSRELTLLCEKEADAFRDCDVAEKVPAVDLHVGVGVRHVMSSARGEKRMLNT